MTQVDRSGSHQFCISGVRCMGVQWTQGPNRSADTDPEPGEATQSDKGLIPTGSEHANLRAIPSMLLVSSVNTLICNRRFHSGLRIVSRCLASSMDWAKKKKWMSEKMGNVVKSMTETREPSISCITKTQICLVKDGSLNPWVIQVKFRLLILAHWGRRNKIWQPKAVLSLGYLVKQTFSAHQGFWQVIQPFFCQDN